MDLQVTVVRESICFLLTSRWIVYGGICFPLGEIIWRRVKSNFRFFEFVIFDFKKKKKICSEFNVLSSGHCKNGFEMKLKLTPPPLPFLKMISRLRENCSEMCSVQSFVKIRIFKLSEFPCYKLIFEYFYELSYVYTCIYNYFDSVFRHRIVFWYFILFSIIKS